jgi:3-dehydroquinate synthase
MSEAPQPPTPSAAPKSETVAVDLGARSYEIRIAAGLIGEAGEALSPLAAARRPVVITDETVDALHGPALMASLTRAGLEPLWLAVPAGEASKDAATLEDLVERMLAFGLDRATPVVAFGGGVVGDLAGFAAAVALRGIPFVQIPTTLLAQVDSAVGGKTGINSRHGKNLIGAFHQPRLVLADIAALDTLPRRQLLAGYAEVVKYGAIDRPEFFAWLEANGATLLAGDMQARARAVRVCCEAKAAIVAEDEREAGRRALLNLGHTFGHALEAATGFGDRLLHGEAVAVGMVLAFTLSARLGICPPADAERLRRHLAAVGLPTAPPPGIAGGPAELLAHMARDKKVSAGRMTFILAEGLGRAFVARDVDPGAVAALLEDALAA